jgi:multiple sugar transport system permease protein
MADGNLPTATAEHKEGLTMKKYGWVLFMMPATIVIFFMIVMPLSYTIYMSVHEWFISSVSKPEFVWFRNYVEILTQDIDLEMGRFSWAIFRTFLYTILGVSAQTIIGVALAILFNRHFFAKGFIRTLSLLPMVATPVAISLVWMMMFNPSLGVLNYFLGFLGLGPLDWVGTDTWVIPSLVMVDTWQWVPLITLIATAGLAALPTEPYEAARIDGASNWQIFWRITLPLLRPTLMVALLFRTIDCLKTFDTIMVITSGGPGTASETLNVYIFQQAFDYFHMGYASALIVIFLAIILGVALLLIKYRRQSYIEY